jgi:hypothetical protein
MSRAFIGMKFGPAGSPAIPAHDSPDDYAKFGPVAL